MYSVTRFFNQIHAISCANIEWKNCFCFHLLEQLTRDAGIETEQVDRNMQMEKPFFILPRTECLVPMHVARQDMRNDGTILCALGRHQDIPV